MIARLRKKFILIAMGSVILVLVVLMGVINTANFVKMNQSADEMLQILSENNGSYPGEDQPKENPDVPGDGPADNPADDAAGNPADDSVNDTADDAADGLAEEDPGSGPDKSTDPGNSRHRDLSPETPYEIRYFSVELNQSGALSSVNTGKIAAVSTEEAVSMAQALMEKGKTSGYEGSYRYLASETENGTLYVFLDCTRDLSSAREFLSTSLLTSLCGILAVFLLVFARSRKAIRPIAESYEKQKQFITNAGHEIKTPLAIIDSCTEVIEMEQGKSKWTEGIRGQVHRLSALTQSLVALARMDEGFPDLKMEEFSLSDAVTETLEPFALLAENGGRHFALEIQPDIRYTGNELLLRQLCSILADNAIKYALPGSEIRFTLKKKGKHPVLVSENAAEGLKAGDQSILFDRFYRGDASRSSETGGYGIGLSLAQSIVTAHGGKIGAGSEDGSSLTITVQL
jgi:signal transduction histidine kinase